MNEANNIPAPGPRQNPEPPIPVQTYNGASEASNLPMVLRIVGLFNPRLFNPDYSTLDYSIGIIQPWIIHLTHGFAARVWRLVLEFAFRDLVGILQSLIYFFWGFLQSMDFRRIIALLLMKSHLN